MEQELFQPESDNIIETHDYLLEKYGSLYQLFFENMLGEGSVFDPMASSYLEKFIGNQCTAELEAVARLRVILLSDAVTL